jgi:hypothetical protein
VSIAPPGTKRPPLKNKHKVPIIVAAITTIGLILAALIPVMVYQLSKPTLPTPTPVPPPSSTSPVPAPRPSPTATTTSPTPPPPDPTGVAVRRTTGDHPLILNADHVADLDSRDGDWGIQGAYEDVIKPDIHFTSSSLRGELAIVSGSDDYETCQYATGYKRDYKSDEFEAGTHFCVRTTEERLAFVAIEKIVREGSSRQLRLNVKVWERP